MDNLFTKSYRIVCKYCDQFEPLEGFDKFIGASRLGFCKINKCYVDDDDLCDVSKESDE